MAPTDVRLLEIDVPPELTVERCEPEMIIADWMIYPAPAELQDFGSKWLTSLRSAVLQVPAAVMPVESNFSLNEQDIVRLRNRRHAPPPARQPARPSAASPRRPGTPQ